AGDLNIAGRRRALVEVGDFVADKLIRLKQALAEETQRRQAVEEQVAENAQCRAELETALAEIQAVQNSFRQELETADNPKQLLALQSCLKNSEQEREELEDELQAARHELQALRAGQAARASELDAKSKELEARRADVEEKIQKLTEALAAE